MTKNPFESTPMERIQQAVKAKTIKAAANALFGPTIDNYPGQFENLRENLKKADMDVLYRTYISEMFFFTLFGCIGGFSIGLIFVLASTATFFEAIRYLIGIPLGIGTIIFGGMYLYPKESANRKRRSIEKNLPFAMNHLSAIATSGIPPSGMFELLAEFDEYGGISREAEKVSRRVNAFGEDFTTALREVAESSPSRDWNEVLYGILSTVETGGNLENFMKEKAEEALFEFKIEKEKQIERLSTYASFYTAILIAAPVFLVTILSVMNLLSSSLGGIPIQSLMWAGIHLIIPGINLIFLLFLGLKVN